MTQKSHVIRPGENLSTIAKQYQLPGWHALYFADANKDFRRANPDPDKILPGKQLNIPPNRIQLRQTLQARLARLEQGKRDSQSFFADQEKSLRRDLKEIKDASTTIDAIATVALLINSLAKTTLQAVKIMKLEGEALVAANREFAKEALKDRAKNVRDLAATSVNATKQESTNVAWLATKSVASAWCDMTSPSFWANTVVNLYDGKSWSDAVNTKPEDVFERSLAQLNSVRTKVLGDLDKKIQEVRSELAGL